MPHRLTPAAALLAALLTIAHLPAAEPDLSAGFPEPAKYEVVSADFRQIRRLKELDMEITIRGSMVSEKNGRLRWQVDSPSSSVTVIDRDKLTHFDRETGKLAVIRKEDLPWLKMLGESMNSWLSGDTARLKRDFTLSVPSPGTLRLVPASEELRSFHRSVELSFDGEKRTLRRILIVEPSGDELEILFSNVKLDSAIPPETWRTPAPAE